MTTRSGSLVFLVIAALLLPRIAAAGEVRVYAAGSLTAAFTDIIKAFPAPAGDTVTAVYGPSGLLREKIEQGAPADILASADMAQPRALAGRDHRHFVVMFTRNRMCALGKASLGLTPDNLLDRLLDPSVRLATSTPGSDPSGDYAWAVFARAETLHPGARAALEAKALKLVGGSNTPPLVPGHGVVEGVFLADRSDVLLSYCSGSQAVMKAVPNLVSVPLPPALTVGPAYGMIVLTDQPVAAGFALFVMSEQGQAILRQHGFDPVGVAPP